jgi:CRISPR/Cas system CSM-associated protein Csm2 small subunit
MANVIKLCQLNAGKRKGALDEMLIRIGNDSYDIIFIQELWTKASDRAKLKNGSLYITSKNLANSPRTGIWLSRKAINNFNPHIIEDFSDRDITTVSLTLNIDNKPHKSLLSSLYLPSYDENSTYIKDPITLTMSELAKFAKKEKFEVILSMDANSHHTLWKSAKNSQRGEYLIDFAAEYELMILNRDKIPTFVQDDKKSIIDLTFSSFKLAAYIMRWKVDESLSHSDHRYIEFDILTSNFSCETKKDPHRTNWIKFSKISEHALSSIPTEISSVEELENVTDSLTKSLLNCYQRCTKISKSKNYASPWYNEHLDSLRKQCQRTFSLMVRAKKRNNINSAENLKLNLNKLRKNYYNECRRAKIHSWRQNMEKIESAKDLSRLQKFFENGRRAQLGAIIREDGSYTSSPIETEHELIINHFPNCHIYDPTQQTIHPSNLPFEKEISEWISTEKVIWSISQPAPYKAPGEDQIVSIMLQKSHSNIVRILREIYIKSVLFNHIPSSWTGALIRFIPKANKVSYDRAKSFRPISLLSVMMKGLDKILDLKIRSEALTKFPLSQSQFAYSRQKSVDSAHHKFIEVIERSLENDGFAITIFCDVQQAFDDLKHDIIEQELRKREVDEWIIAWIMNMLSSRRIKADITGSSTYYTPTQGVPQGLTSACTMFNIVINSLIERLERNVDIFDQTTLACNAVTVDFADDVTIILKGKISRKESLPPVGDIALKIVDNWCTEYKFIMNPDKTTAMIITKHKVKWKLRNLVLKNQPIQWVDQQKLLGVIIDRTFSFVPHINYQITKAKKSLFMSKALLGRTWGISPRSMAYIWNSMIIPRILFSAIIWWRIIQYKKYTEKLNSLQRLAAMLISGASKTTPTYALFNILGLSPMEDRIYLAALKTSIRLHNWNAWHQNNTKNSHTLIASDLQHILNNKTLDNFSYPIDFTDKFLTIISSPSTWNKNLYIKGNPDLWFSDASKRFNRTAIAFVNPNTHVKHDYRISDHANILQAETLAVSMCATYILNHPTNSNSVVICTDSQQTVSNLRNPITHSRTVKECKEKLNLISQTKKVHIVWTPKSLQLPGNITADNLAKLARDRDEIDLTAHYGIATISNSMSDLELSLSSKTWNNKKRNLGFASTMLDDYDPTSSSYLLTLPRKKIRMIIALKSGHAPTKAFLNKIGKAADAQCRLCLEDNDESIRHWITDCPALESTCRTCLGDDYLNPDSYKLLTIKQLIRFAKLADLYSLISPEAENLL